MQTVVNISRVTWEPLGTSCQWASLGSRSCFWNTILNKNKKYGHLSKVHCIWQLAVSHQPHFTPNTPGACAKITRAARQAWLKMNEYYYIIPHKQFVYCNHGGRGSQREEQKDIRVLFSFNRLGKGGRYARYPGNASVKLWVRIRGGLCEHSNRFSG